jgi:DNA replication protein DnaC
VESTTEQEVTVLIQPTLEKLTDMRLSGLRRAVEEQVGNPQYADLSFEERFSLLIDQEWTRRQDDRLKRRLKRARFRQQATIEDLDFGAKRGLDRRLILQLATGEWITQHLNVIVTGATGVGKTFLVCSLGRSACKAGYSVRYERLSHLLHEFTASHADESWSRLLASLGRVDLLVLDDWLRDPVRPSQARDLVEILDDRYNRCSTLVATQVPVEDWHSKLNDPDLADAILDRLAHNAHRIEMRGESQRKTRSPLSNSIPSEVR